MKRGAVIGFLLVLVIAGVMGVCFFVGHSARDDSTGVKTVRRESGPTEPAPSTEDSPDGEAELLHFLDEELEEKMQPPVLVKSVEGWDKDAKHEADLIAKETFTETLCNTADYRQNYFRMIFSECLDHPASADNLKMIVMTRRFAKLVEEMRSGGPSQEQVDELLTQLRSDVSKFRDMKAKEPEFSRTVAFGGTANDPELDDQSDLPMALCWRLNVADLLIGQFVIHEGLPLVLESLDARDGTFLKNWTSVSYACDKILSDDPPGHLTPDQHQLRKEYLDWKAGLPDVSQDASGELRRFDKRFFNYQRVELPSYRSARRPHDRATAMGAPLDHASYGTVIMELPPKVPREGADIGIREPRPQVDIVAFARRFLDAGHSKE